MTRIVFHDVDEFENALGGVVGRFVPLARSTHEWWLHGVARGRVLTQIIRVGGCVTFAGDGKHEKIALQIPLTAPAMVRVDGVPLERESFLCIREGVPFTLSTRETTRWVAIILPSNHELLAAEFMASVISPISSNGTTTRVCREPEHLARIRVLAERLMAASEGTSHDVIAHRSTEEDIVVLASRALESSHERQPRNIGRPRTSRARAISRTLALIESSKGSPLLSSDLCHATGLKERTLRSIFHEYFGVGPMRLLKAHQLCQVRTALLAADPAHESVRNVAARFGVSDFSSFARHYKALFGESPSLTLRTAPRPTQGSVADRNTWLYHAARALSRQTCSAR